MVQTKREKHQAYSASSQSQAANDFKLESEEWSMLSRVRFFATPWAVAHQAPSVHGILQKRILEWVAFSSQSSSPRDQTQVCSTAGGFYTI